MRISQYFVNTMRETPSEAEIVSHNLMLRAGMIKKQAAGVYSYMPMGYKIIRKISQIVRECMNEEGAIEIHMPGVIPAELWQESGRWKYYGKELLRLKDRHDREFCVGPTHEEVVTDIVRSMVHSYKQMPLNLYQIQTKFRDEVRPRFGLIRGREFLMKDAYSFDTSHEGALISYEKMRRAYCKIFDKCGLKYKMVEADSGSIGGSMSHEFMVLANTGEDAVISCESCHYGANMEKAIATKAAPVPATDLGAMRDVDTPATHTVDEVAAFLSVKPSQVIKTIIVNIDDKLMAILVRGDHEANFLKLKTHLGASTGDLAEPEEVIAATGAPVGFAGPIGLKIPIYADHAVMEITSAVTGANKKDKHFVGVIPGKDFTPDFVGDFRNANPGDICPKCGGTYTIARGIEVGHIFYLGTKYSKPMKATYLDVNGKEQVIEMGTYGIGVSRIAAAAIEQSHDDAGIIWPAPIAPFEAVVMAMNTNDEEIVSAAEKAYSDLLKAGVDVIYDDRNERAGVKLSDADLIGYPLKITVGRKTYGDGFAEVKKRATGDTELVKINNLTEYVTNLLSH